MRRLANHEDDLKGIVTYMMADGTYLSVDARATREFGLTALLRQYGIAPSEISERLPVIRDGRKIGTLPAYFDPTWFRSRGFYEPRPDDFTLVNDTWIVSPTLGASDVDCVVGFIREAE